MALSQGVVHDGCTMTHMHEAFERLLTVLQQKGLLTAGDMSDTDYIKHGQYDIMVTNNPDNLLDRILDALGLDMEPDEEVLDRLFEQALADGNGAAEAIRFDYLEKKWKARDAKDAKDATDFD